MAKPEPTYQELVALRQQEWEAKQKVAAEQLATVHERILQMPDVKMAPSPDLPWSHPAIKCLWCAGKEFYAVRWVSLNGVRYRAELKCVGCEKSATWDWADNAWMAP